MPDGDGYIEQITLSHMNEPIDMKERLMNHTGGNEQYLALWLVQEYFNIIDKELGKDADPRLRRRALDQSKYLAIQRLPDLAIEIEAGHIFLLDEAERTGWFHSDFFGWDTLEEMLASQIDPDSMVKSEVSDRLFVVKTLLPAARSFGMKPNKLLAATCQVKKLRRSVPTARQILEELEMGDKKPKEAEKEIKQLIEWVADARTTYTQFETNIGKREPPEAYRSINVFEVSLPGGEIWMVIPIKTETDKRIIDRMLNHRMKKKFRALPWILEELKKWWKFDGTTV